MIEATPASPRRRLRKRTIIVTALISLAVVAGALWALDNWARQQVASYVTEKVHEVLDSDEPVTVEIAGFSVIAQVLTGSFEQVDVSVDDVTIGEFTGDVELRAKGIPTDLERPVDSVQIAFTVKEESLQQIAHLLSASAIDSVTLVDSQIQLATTFSLFGFSVDVGVAVEPFADNGEIGFTPTSVSLNGATTSVEDLSDTFGSVAGSLLQTQSICVASWLPEALTVDDVAVRGDTLVITISSKTVVLDEAALSTLGTCPA